MKKTILVTIFLAGIAANFICLTINVARTDIGGIVGTVVLGREASDEDIQSARLFLRVTGIGWGIISVGIAAYLFNYRE